MSGWNWIPSDQMTMKAGYVLALCGEAGAGKTFTALLIAQYLAKLKGGPVYAIETDMGRIAKYKQIPALNPFHAVLLDDPFGPDRYLDAIQDADNRGAGCIIVDNMSDEWESPGGILDLQATAAKRIAGGDREKELRSSLAAWNEVKGPKSDHNKLSFAISRTNAHLIICLRAREKTEPRKNAQGRVVPTKIGVEPIMATDLDFKFDIFLRLSKENPGSYDKVLKPNETEKDVWGDSGFANAALAQKLYNHLAETMNAPVPSSAASSSKPAEATQQPPDPTPSGDVVEWGLDMANNRFKCVQGNPDSKPALKALYLVIKEHLHPGRNWNNLALDVEKELMANSADLIAKFPKTNREEIDAMVAALPAEVKE